MASTPCSSISFATAQLLRRPHDSQTIETVGDWRSESMREPSRCIRKQ